MYPIRISRPIWCQTFYKEHICSSFCDVEYKIDNNIIRISYTSECLFPEKIEPSCINLYKYEQSNYIDDKIKLCKNEVMIKIDYPMNNIFIKKITIDKDEIRVSDILKIYHDLYKKIYEEEESKSTIKTFIIEVDCDACDDNYYEIENLDKFMEKTDMIDKQCNICFDDQNLYSLKGCGHIFHKECITKWFDTSKINDDTGEQIKSNSCPSCRQSMIFCNKCKTKRFIEIQFEGPIPPYNPKIPDFIRNQTDGPYEIHSLYFEELMFKGIMYNNTENSITLIPYDEIYDDSEQEIELELIESIE